MGGQWAEYKGYSHEIFTLKWRIGKSSKFDRKGAKGSPPEKAPWIKRKNCLL
jgi:hypothetical protein